MQPVSSRFVSSSHAQHQALRQQRSFIAPQSTPVSAVPTNPATFGRLRNWLMGGLLALVLGLGLDIDGYVETYRENASGNLAALFGSETSEGDQGTDNAATLIPQHPQVGDTSTVVASAPPAVATPKEEEATTPQQLVVEPSDVAVVLSAASGGGDVWPFGLLANEKHKFKGVTYDYVAKGGGYARRTTGAPADKIRQYLGNEIVAWAAHYGKTQNTQTNQNKVNAKIAQLLPTLRTLTAEVAADNNEIMWIEPDGQTGYNPVGILQAAGVPLNN